MEKNTKETYYKNMSLKAEDVDVEDQRLFTAIITDDSIDRDKEVLLPSGLNKKDFVKNGIILFNHNQNDPIGTATSLRRSGNGWKATGKIAEEGTDSHIDKIWKLVKQGILKGVSVGYQIEEQRPPTPEDKAMFGKAVEWVVSKWKLLEFSVVSVPANQNALILAAKAINLDPKVILGEDYEEVEVDEKGIEEEIVEVKTEEEIKKDIVKEIDAEIKQLEEDITLEAETKEKLVEVVKEEKVDIKEVMKYFTEEYKKQIKKNKGMLF